MPSGPSPYQTSINLRDALLRLPRLPGEVVEIRDVEARLVALGVKADQAGRVRKLAEEGEFRRAVLLNKQTIELRVESIAPATSRLMRPAGSCWTLKV